MIKDEKKGAGESKATNCAGEFSQKKIIENGKDVIIKLMK
jgi:hypothetical protein